LPKDDGRVGDGLPFFTASSLDACFLSVITKVEGLLTLQIGESVKRRKINI
jgi:hypothetical protein